MLNYNQPYAPPGGWWQAPQNGWQAPQGPAPYWAQEILPWDLEAPAWAPVSSGMELWKDLLDELDADEQPSAEPELAQPVKAMRSKPFNRILNLFTYCFVAFLLAGSTMFAFSNSAEKSLLGYRFYNVLTPSMQPAFKPGDMIFVKLTKPSEVKVGDIVTFNPSPKSTAFLTHRVVELLPADESQPDRMVTKGDFNNTKDPPVGLSAVIGVHTFTIPVMGRVVEMMRNNLLLVCICFGAVFLLLAVLRAYFAARKQEKTALKAFA
ncbi:MAG: signal peptidase I [Oscillospiraceae bacterium]|nr:signal peptidase I [Oscillospiraceae bacterium]